MQVDAIATGGNLLLVEDDDDLRIQMKWGLAKEYRVLEAVDRGSALDAFARGKPPVVTLDLGLAPDPDGVSEGFAVLAAILEADPMAKVIIITGQDGRENALKALEGGAYDFLTKPVRMEDLKIILRRAFYLSGLERDFRNLKALAEEEPPGGMLGTSPRIRKVFEEIRKVAASDVPVLLVGESGTGKELAARAIHDIGPRKDGPFISINCGAIPENLLERELFGPGKGSITGAHDRGKGRLEAARGGILFLDEIGDLPGPLQVKILDYLQHREIEKGEGRDQGAVDSRIVAATNRDIGKAIKEGQFRNDLFYRLGVVTILMPPLRDREGDILPLAKSFLQRYSWEKGGKPRSFTALAEKAIQTHDWPGNVRELENRVKRAVIMANGPKIKPADLELPVSPTRGHDGGTLKEGRENFERERISEAIKTHGGNLSRAAAGLGIRRRTLYDLMRKLGIERG